MAQQDNARERIQRLQKHVKDRFKQTKKHTYAYRKIDYNKEIRVLKIYKDEPDSFIAARLVRHTLSDRTASHRQNSEYSIPYSALSYYWGVGEPANKVYLFPTDDDYEGWKEIPKTPETLPSHLSMVGHYQVGDNLYAALKVLRSKHEDVYVWTDALCINQSDLREKTVQVSHMHEIYAHAETVCIWLGNGPGRDEVEKTFQFLNRILDLEGLEQVVKRLEFSSPDDQDQQDCKRVINLMKADWFCRRWIIQEVALATNPFVRQGHREMPWTEFTDAIALFTKKYHLIQHAFPSPQTFAADRDTDNHFILALDAKALGANTLITVTNNLFRRSNAKIQQHLLSIEELVSSMLLAFEASNPKDTVFAVLQIAKDTLVQEKEASLPTSVMGIIIRYIVPLCGIIIWQSTVNFLPQSSPEKSTLDISLRYTELPTTTFSYRLLSNGILVVGMLLLWMIYTLLLDWIDKFFSKARAPDDGIQVPKPLDKRIEPDYQKCLRDVYADFISYCIDNSNSLDILCRHWAPRPQELPSDLPSWILPLEGHAFGGPQQRLKGRVNGDGFVGPSEKKRIYATSRNLLPSYKFGMIKASQEAVRVEAEQQDDVYASKGSHNSTKEHPPRYDGTLEIKGFQFDTIEECESIVGPVIGDRGLELCGWSKKAAIPKSNDFWRILVADRDLDGNNVPNW
jgi:hypothetical protein